MSKLHSIGNPYTRHDLAWNGFQLEQSNKTRSCHGCKLTAWWQECLWTSLSPATWTFCHCVVCKLREWESTVLYCRCHGCYDCSCQNNEFIVCLFEEQLVRRAIGTCEASGAQSQPEFWVMIFKYCWNSIEFNHIQFGIPFLEIHLSSMRWVGAGTIPKLSSLKSTIKGPPQLQAALEKLHQLPAASAKTWTKTSEAYGEQFKAHNITALVEGNPFYYFYWCCFFRLMGFRRWKIQVLRCQRKCAEIVG